MLTANCVHNSWLPFAMFELLYAFIVMSMYHSKVTCCGNIVNLKYTVSVPIFPKICKKIFFLFFSLLVWLKYCGFKYFPFLYVS